MAEGLRQTSGTGTAAPPYRNGPYKWDQQVSFTQGINGCQIGSTGKIYYVDEENGSDSNDGLTPQTAFATLEKCFGNTTGNKVARDDYSDDAEYHIFVAPGTYAPTLDLRLYGHGIHIHGMGIPGTDSGVNITDSGASVTYGIMLVGAANCTIENIEFISTTALPPLYLIASDNTVVRNCRFKGTSGTSNVAIHCLDVRSTEIAYCQIGEAAGDYTTGIYGAGGADQYVIDSYFHHNRMASNNTSAKFLLLDNTCTCYNNVIDNNFINLTGTTPVGIDVNSTGVNLITNNYIVITSGATAIESASSPTGIVGNHTLAGTTTVDPNEAAG
jgi:hypothetical protein